MKSSNAMATLTVNLVTLEKTAYSGTASGVTVPTSEGIITVLPGHEPTIGLIAPGALRIALPDGSHEQVILTKGFFEVRPEGEVVILADSADSFGEIDIESLRRSKEEAEERRKKSGPDASELEVAYLEEVLAREIARLDIAHRITRKP